MEFKDNLQIQHIVSNKNSYLFEIIRILIFEAKLPTYL